MRMTKIILVFWNFHNTYKRLWSYKKIFSDSVTKQITQKNQVDQDY